MKESGFEDILSVAAQIVEQSIKTSFPEVINSDLDIELSPPPQWDQGDFAFSCFKLAKQTRQNPAQIAQALVNQINQDPTLSQYIEFAQAVGPYLNLRLKADLYLKHLLLPMLSKNYFVKPVVHHQPKTMIEFSQPNTHKELHVGHMRNACLGDALVKIKRMAGIEVIASTFPGDIGAHVAKCLWYLHYHEGSPVPEQKKGEWLGQLYSKAHLKLEDEKGTPAEEINREQLTNILKQLENQTGPFYDLWQETRQWSIELMQKVYDWLGIHFDVWYWESQVDQSSRDYVKGLYQNGQLVQSQGAIGYDLSEYKLGFCLLLKSDGTGLYATKDLELAKRKFEEYEIERSIYVVDTRQALHFSQIFKVLELLGFKQASNCYHLSYNFVELPDGAMSSRKGNIIPITDLVQKMQFMIIEKYLNRYSTEWSSQEIKQVAHQVAMGAIKYGMLKMDTAKKIVFDMEEWLKIDGDSGPFIQYSAARIKSIKRKVESDLNWDLITTADQNLLAHNSELQLRAQLSYYRRVLKQSALQEKPHLLTHYLFETAQAFNYFYHECPILAEDNKLLRQQRILLALATGEALEQGLALLGIPTPEKM